MHDEPTDMLDVDTAAALGYLPGGGGGWEPTSGDLRWSNPEVQARVREMLLAAVNAADLLNRAWVGR